jgi:death-on-curing protein
MLYITPHEVLVMHARVIDVVGGSHGVRDVGALEAAVYKPQAQFGGADLYVGLFVKAAVLLECIVHSHPFVDGNKRSAFMSAVRFLEINGYLVSANSVPDTMVAVATGVMSVEGLAVWLEKYSRKM